MDDVSPACNHASMFASLALAFVVAPPSAGGPPLLDPRDPASAFGRAVAAHELAAPLAAIEAQLRRGAARAPAPGVIPTVRSLFDAPWSLHEVASALADSTRTARLGGAPGAFVAQACSTDLPSPDGTGRQTIASAHHAVQALDYFIRAGDLLARQALEPAIGIEPGPGDQERPGNADDEGAAPIHTARAALARDAIALLALIERTLKPDGDDAALARRTAEAAWKIDWAIMARLAAHADLDFDVTCDWSAESPEALPEELAGAVEGPVLTASYIDPIGWAVVGGTGPNRYDMSMIAAVFDPGGDDRYEWPKDVIGSRAIVDLAGDDHYVSKGVAGPGGALLGFGLVRDLAGNDRYEGTVLSSGAGMLGAGILIDDAGDDVHVSRAFSQGAGFLGAGVLVDGAGDDRYTGKIFCQGVGGPRGAGALIDRAGDDLYEARGAMSAYDTPATFRSFSQGVGVGMRRDLPGGIGVLADDAGNDRYESGEFSQGGGYFFALGVLADRGGRDLYRGDRYAQGFAAHQAFGALLESSGDDVYWSRTAAGQGAAWDESATILVDRAGNDHYRADGLSQGAAAQQALGALVDLGGDDVFDAAGSSSQGAGGSNQYHFAECGCYSLGVLLKRGGTARYSSGRPEGAVTFSAEIKPDDPQGSSAYGLHIDE